METDKNSLDARVQEFLGLCQEVNTLLDKQQGDSKA